MLNEKSRVKVLFDRKKYIEYEVPDEGIMFYSEIDEKTYFLNFMAIYILEFSEGMSIEDIFLNIKNNFDIEGISESELYNDIYEICNILIENSFIEIMNQG